MARLCPLFSGSTGNSYYLGSKSRGVLIDAGRSARQIESALALCGIDIKAVAGILITHEHTDHITGVRVLAKRHNLKVFASPGTLRAMRTELEGIETREVSGKFELSGIEVLPFSTSHDSAEPFGYRLKLPDGRVFAIATDLGTMTEEVREAVKGADLTVIESNYDMNMLRDGPYPLYLKERILSKKGHLANSDCAAALPELVKSGTRRFLLSHLSRENNTPEKALETSLASLEGAGYIKDIDFHLEAALPENPGKSIIF